MLRVWHDCPAYVECRACDDVARLVVELDGQPVELCRRCARALGAPLCAVQGCRASSTARLQGPMGPGYPVCPEHHQQATERGKHALDYAETITCGNCSAARRNDLPCPSCGSERQKR